MSCVRLVASRLAVGADVACLRYESAWVMYPFRSAQVSK